MTVRDDIETLLDLPSAELFRRFPHAAEFFADSGIGLPPGEMSPRDYLATVSRELLEDLGMERADVQEQLASFLVLGERLRTGDDEQEIRSITIRGGRDKGGRPEGFTLTIEPGEIICIVGPTGSGKSRFLADIEWLAQGDSPTGRTILINGVVPEPGSRFSRDRKLVAQLSQNMNFVMDLTVEEFVAMHAESRMVADVAAITRTVVALANDMAGERFTPGTPVTSLSGGQSRALMIADTSCLSSSPIVLIDEIENAGIDRKRAVQVLVDKRKIVLMATHDPILALLGGRRLVFRNGGICRIIETSAAERSHLARLEEMDAQLTAIRTALRNGETIG